MALKVPAYRLRAGYTQAIVTLSDSETGKRRDYWRWARMYYSGRQPSARR